MPNLRIKRVPTMFTNMTNETFPSPLSLPNSQIRRLPQRLSCSIQTPDVPHADCAAQFTNQLEVASSLNLCSLHKSNVIQSESGSGQFTNQAYFLDHSAPAHFTNRTLPSRLDRTLPISQIRHFPFFCSQTTKETFPSTLSQYPIHRSDPFHHQATGALSTDQTGIVFTTNRPLLCWEIRLASSSSPIDRCPIRTSD